MRIRVETAERDSERWGRQRPPPRNSFRPAEGFNWAMVSWSGPDEPPAEICSYCEDTIPRNDVPLMLFTAGAWTARFCKSCRQRWWGFRG